MMSRETVFKRYSSSILTDMMGRFKYLQRYCDASVMWIGSIVSLFFEIRNGTGDLNNAKVSAAERLRRLAALLSNLRTMGDKVRYCLMSWEVRLLLYLVLLSYLLCCFSVAIAMIFLAVVCCSFDVSLWLSGVSARLWSFVTASCSFFCGELRE